MSMRMGRVLAIISNIRGRLVNDMVTSDTHEKNPQFYRGYLDALIKYENEIMKEFNGELENENY